MQLLGLVDTSLYRCQIFLVLLVFDGRHVDLAIRVGYTGVFALVATKRESVHFDNRAKCKDGRYRLSEQFVEVEALRVCTDRKNNSRISTLEKLGGHTRSCRFKDGKPEATTKTPMIPNQILFSNLPYLAASCGCI